LRLPRWLRLLLLQKFSVGAAVASGAAVVIAAFDVAMAWITTWITTR